DAYSVGDNVVQMVFDRNVDATSATTLSNYYDGALRTPLSVALVTPHSVNVTWAVSGGVALGSPITVNTTGVESSDLSPPNDIQRDTQTRTCVNGVQTIMDIQSPNPDSLAAATCKDVSKFIPTGYFIPSQSRLTFRAVSTGAIGSSDGMEDAGRSL